MNVVRQAIYLCDVYIVVARNGSENGFYPLSDVRIDKYLFSVFRAPGNMVPEIISCVAGFSYYHILFIVSLKPFSEPLLVSALIPQF